MHAKFGIMWKYNTNCFALIYTSCWNAKHCLFYCILVVTSVLLRSVYKACVSLTRKHSVFMKFSTFTCKNLPLQDLIREVDPDIITGFNICRFDLPYLIEVGEHFLWFLYFDNFILLSILLKVSSKIKNNSF